MATASATFSTTPSQADPYTYQVGFGNRFASEAIPGTLPHAQNHPQKCKYELYNEGITGNPFVGTRPNILNAFLYRVRPSVAHQGFKSLPPNPHLESNFLPINPRVHVSPTQLAWRPLDIPPSTTEVDFVDGIKTMAGNGDPTLHEGLAVHIYVANTSMKKRAFCNNDGDMLFMPQQGRLDIQTEFGKMMVRPGELAVIQRGIKFKVLLPDGPSRGYIEEIYGSHYELPELGPVGGHGLANPRDFEFPVASFDLDQSPWEIAYKVGGKLFSCSQQHTPFDVVAWHGNYVPYKYNMEKFIFVGSISKDHIDPSIFIILTAKSKCPGVPLTDVLLFYERWDVASDTFRPPYYHRNNASEVMGLIYGNYEGRSDQFMPGSLSHETVFCPHGVSYDTQKAASEGELRPVKVHKGTMAIMFETAMTLTLTDYAMTGTGKIHEHDVKMWDGLQARFMNHLDEINTDLKAAGLPELQK